MISGLAHQLDAVVRKIDDALGPSKLWVEYTNRTAQYVRKDGRQVLFWGEDPMQAGDIPSLVTWAGKRRSSAPLTTGISCARYHQTIYTNLLPEDPLFPPYYVFSPPEEVRSPRSHVEPLCTV